MKAVNGKRFYRLFEERGWELKSINGSHYIFSKPGATIRISVPMHGNKALKFGLQKHLMKIAGIAQAEL